MARKLVGARVPPELYEQVAKKAKAQDLTLAQIVRKLLRQYVDDCKKGEVTAPTEKTT